MLLKLAFKNLFRNTRRTLAILLTIALGAGALFSFDGFIKGMLDQYRDQTIHSHYGYGQINTVNYRDKVYEEPWKHWVKNTDQVIRYLDELDEVQGVFPRVTFNAQLKYDDTSINASGQGIDAEKESDFFYSLDIIEGEQLINQPYGLLLGRGLAKSLDVKPGDTVTVLTTSSKNAIGRAKLNVVGIFETGSQDYDSRIFKIQLFQAQNLLRTTNIETISLGLNELKDWDKVESSVEERFPKLEATPFNILDKVYYQHSVDWLNAQYRVVQVIILIIVLLGIFNSISSTILERKQEIGNLRANGESVFSVMKLIVTEGTLMGILGSFLGIVLAYFLLTYFVDKNILLPPGPGLTREVYISFSFNLPMVYRTMFLTIITAIIASFLGGMKVAKMPIAKALRSH